MPSRARGLRGNFYPRPPRGGRQRLHRQRAGGSAISIHALREEGDGLFTVPYEAVKIFLSTPSARRATQTHQAAHGRDRFLSTPSARRATESTGLIESSSGISIHALREEGDLAISAFRPITTYFYPRPPRGGRLLKNGCAFVSMNISIHALREEGDRSSTTKAPTGTISIHALREEGDRQFGSRIMCFADFYPRPPRGGRPP